MADALVIVESPAKAKTINKILGQNYEVASSMGHIMDLPGNSFGVDVENNFKPEYVIIPGRKTVVKKLKAYCKDKSYIYLATDPDREGEAISYHLAELLGKNKNVSRVAFNEITDKAVLEAFSKPGKIDMDKVNSQQARRILDRIVGYELSPLLWRKVGRGLSAGRVQSVAVRLIVEREREIRAFVPQEYWEIEAELEKRESIEHRAESIGQSAQKRFLAKLEKIDDKKADIKNKDQADKIVADLKGKDFVVDKIEKKEKQRLPYAPFTTSKLQQEAFNRLHFLSYKTMRVAQDLYEGIELGKEGHTGLITYMRTDSVRCSEESINEARSFIESAFGREFVPDTPNRYKSKKTAQGAHEAIRPTSAKRDPESIKEFLTDDQYKLYKLIWSKFVASQMKPARILVTTVGIKADSPSAKSRLAEADNYYFKATGSVELFKGWTIIYPEPQEKEQTFSELSEGELLNLIALIPSQHFTKPPARYTDGSLVKALEEDGIGRPSTYAPIIQTIVTRDYVRRQKGVFVPTELGEVVTDLLIEHFPVVLDVQFTANMENELDKVEEGRADWVGLLKEFYQPFSKTLAEAKIRMKDLKREVIPSSEVCNKCGMPMVIKWGRRGKFLSCSGFPNCKNAKSITSGVKCPQGDCGGELIERRSKRGMFYGCTNYPKCKFTSRTLPSDKEITDGTIH